jgi:hypothetical protein
MRLLSCVLFACLAQAVAFAAKTPEFYGEVEAVLQRNCVGCHRAGEIGPMAFTTYEEVRPWAKAIKNSVATKRMPPWFADPAYGHFGNDRSLKPEEIDLITKWVDAGAPKGDVAKKVKAIEYVEGWNIPQPDLVVGMKEPFPVPANSKIDYQYIVVPTGLTEDKWVNMVEARPSDRSVVHHAVVFIRDPKSKWLREAQPYVPYVPDRQGAARRIDVGGGGNEILHTYTPGNLPDVWKPHQAKLIPAGSDLVFQMHYTSTKKDTEDLTRIGLVFSKEPPTERIMTIIGGTENFKIPPGDPNYTASATLTLPNDATLLSFFPHMHVRGKAFEYTLTENGKEETLLKVNNYDFNWQLNYRLAEPRPLKAGAKIKVTATWDNSPNNKWNPDPTATVTWGEQSWEEMAYGFMDFAIDARHDRRSWIQRKPLPKSDE